MSAVKNGFFSLAMKVIMTMMLIAVMYSIIFKPQPVIAQTDKFYIKVINPPVNTKYITAGWNGISGGPVLTDQTIEMSVNGHNYAEMDLGLSIVSWPDIFGIQTFNAYKGGSTTWKFTPVAGKLYTVDFHSSNEFEPVPDITISDVPIGIVVGTILPRATVSFSVNPANIPNGVTSWDVLEAEEPDGGNVVQRSSIVGIHDIIEMNVPALCGYFGTFYNADGSRYQAVFDFDWCLNKDGANYVYYFDAEILR